MTRIFEEHMTLQQLVELMQEELFQNYATDNGTKGDNRDNFTTSW